MSHFFSHMYTKKYQKMSQKRRNLQEFRYSGKINQEYCAELVYFFVPLQRKMPREYDAVRYKII